MLAAQKLRGEADEAFSENEEMKIQAQSFINAAEAGYQTVEEQAQNQFMEMAMNHRQQIAGLEMMQGQKVSFLEMNAATTSIYGFAEAFSRNGICPGATPEGTS